MGVMAATACRARLVLTASAARKAFAVRKETLVFRGSKDHKALRVSMDCKARKGKWAATAYPAMMESKARRDCRARLA